MWAFFLSMFAVGLATSVHCISMCGPMVVTYAVKSDESDRWQDKVVPNVAYQGAKLTSYVLIGFLLGAIGAAFDLNGIRPWIMAAAGIFMIILGLGMTGRVPWAARLTPRPPRFLIDALTKLRRKASSDAKLGESSIATPIAFGLLTGLFPCAPLQAAELAAAGTGNALYGGAAMLAFGLGTMPLLFAFGTASSFIPADWKKRMTFVLAFVVMGLGLVFLNRTALLVGFPVNSSTIKTAVLGAPASTGSRVYKTGADGVAEVPLTIANGQYQPAALDIPAEKPVRLVVDRKDALACSNQIVFPQLGVRQDLRDNATTVVNLPATKAGTYTMTCGMGMMSGQLVVGGAVGPGGSSGGPSPIVWLGVTFVAAAGALYVARGVRPGASAGPANKSSNPNSKRKGAAPKSGRNKPAGQRARG